MLNPALAATRPAEFGALVKALAECLKAAAVMTEPTQPTSRSSAFTEACPLAIASMIATSASAQPHASNTRAPGRLGWRPDRGLLRADICKSRRLQRRVEGLTWLTGFTESPK